jgi:hypothetical protein
MSIEQRIIEAKKFFDLKGLASDEIIRRGHRKGIAVSFIERAMVEVSEAYDELKDRDGDLVWRVWKVAQRGKGFIYQTVYPKQGNEIQALKRIIWLLVAYGITATTWGVLKCW